MKIHESVGWVLLACLIAGTMQAQDVSSILTHIQSDQASGVPSSQSIPPPTIPRHDTRQRKQGASIATSPGGSEFFHPKDRLPGNIAGKFLIGEFCVLGEYIDGGAVIYAVEDDGKGFIRQFVVKNASSGLAPGNYYPEGQKPRVRYTRSNPLVFTGKLFPGLYSVLTTR